VTPADAVVFESDDWGMERRDCSRVVGRFGPVSDWAREEMETEADVRALRAVLLRHRDGAGRHPVFTANVVVANPDFDAIEASGFSDYHDVPLARAHPALVAAYREAAARGVWLAQHHGRSHLSAAAWLADLRAGEPRALELFRARCPGGLSLLRDEDPRYNSEYAAFHPATGEWLGVDPRFVEVGLDSFAELFGFRSRSTIPPHYCFPDEIEATWAEAGVRFVQGCSRRMVPEGGGWRARPSAPGHVGASGCIHLVRTVRFDPRPASPEDRHWRGALAAALACRDRGEPVVVDTHRINYTAPWRDGALAELDQLLGALTAGAPVRFLTTPELGDLVAGDAREPVAR
jgi:hypothetical protein